MERSGCCSERRQFSPQSHQKTRLKSRALWGFTGEIRRWTGKRSPTQGTTCNLALPVLVRTLGATLQGWPCEARTLQCSRVCPRCHSGGPRPRSEPYLIPGTPTEVRRPLSLFQVRAQTLRWGESKQAFGPHLPFLTAGCCRTKPGTLRHPLPYPTYVTPL